LPWMIFHSLDHRHLPEGDDWAQEKLYKLQNNDVVTSLFLLVYFQRLLFELIIFILCMLCTERNSYN
jgi:hypothetical protein